MTNRLESYFSALADSNTPTTLATVVQAVSPTAASPGDKALVSADRILDGWNGGGCAQPAVIAAAAEVLADGVARLIRVAPKGQWAAFDGVSDFSSGCLSGGTLVIFVEPLQRPTRLVIYGSSPAAVHLSRLATEVGFAVTAAGPDVDGANLPDSVHVTQDIESARGDFVVIATQGRHDRAAIGAAINNSDATHIAMIASSKKSEALKAQLLDEGIDASVLARIKSPAGIGICAETPAEVALSVLAELVEKRRTGVDNRKLKPVESSKTGIKDVSVGGCCGS